MTTTSPSTPALSNRSRRIRILGAAIGAATVAAGVGLVAPAIAGSNASHATARTKTSAHATSVTPATSPHQAATPGSAYLALGDSVPFGYTEPHAIPKPHYKKAASFIGWPQDVARALDLKLSNASCPGETTTSFMNTKAQSIGCENRLAAKKGKKPIPGGYRTVYPLHVKYASAHQSQLSFAEKFLKANPSTRLVTLMIGANDGFICEEQTSDGCVSELGAYQKKITKNVGTILHDLRSVGGYQGQIVVALYYSTDYTSFIAKAGSQALDSALKLAAAKYDAETANSYATFRKAAATYKGSTCKAGLLTHLTLKKKPCGVHLSPAGAAVLAQTVEAAVKK